MVAQLIIVAAALLGAALESGPETAPTATGHTTTIYWSADSQGVDVIWLDAQIRDGEGFPH